MLSEKPVTEKEIHELAEHIYDLDCEVYANLGSALGRVFNRDREKCVDELVELLITRPNGNLVRSELALIANMARTIPDQQGRKLCMRKYNRILQAVMTLPTSFASGDVIDPKLAKLNEFNVRNRFSGDDHLIICISWAYGSGGIDVGFKLADKLKINYYDAEIFQAVQKRLEAEQDALYDVSGYSHVSRAIDQSLASVFKPMRRKTLREKIRTFSRYHGLSTRDAVFFNQSDLLCDMANKEDFIIMGRCADAIMTTNNIPHISIYITAPMEQRIHRAIEVNKGIDEKKAKRLLKRLDHEHAGYYNFYTSKKWGQASNYDLCINTASYGIDGAVEFIYKMIGRK